MATIKILLVDDDEIVRSTLSALLEDQNFEVITASNVSEALKCINADSFDVLLSDLHMPGAGDGLTVVSAMRHANPKAITILLSAFPEMSAAAHAILLQADEILVKPMDIKALVDVIRQRLASGPSSSRMIESVASIIERSIETILGEWFGRVEMDGRVRAVSLTREARTGHISKALLELVSRLRSPKALGSSALESVAAREHGTLRRKQGYSGAMLVEESRMLQVSIFHTLERNLGSIDFSLLLNDVMTIADEVDWQLSQAMQSYHA